MYIVLCLRWYRGLNEGMVLSKREGHNIVKVSDASVVILILKLPDDAAVRSLLLLAPGSDALDDALSLVERFFFLLIFLITYFLFISFDFGWCHRLT